MSNVVAFKPAERGRIVRDQSQEGGLILLFTGVRYMREECALDAALGEEPAEAGEAEPDLDTTTERLKA